MFRCKRLPPCKARDIVSASADRGTPSPTSLWLVDLPPLAVCSFNSLFQPYSRPRCRVADCQSRLHPRFRLSVPICQRAIFPSLPRAAYLPSALRSGNLPCALLGIEPNALAGWRVTHRAGNWLCSSSHLLLTCEIRHHVDTGRVFRAFCEPNNKCGIGRLLQ